MKYRVWMLLLAQSYLFAMNQIDDIRLLQAEQAEVLALSDDGALLMSARGKYLALWDVVSGKKRVDVYDINPAHKTLRIHDMSLNGDASVVAMAFNEVGVEASLIGKTLISQERSKHSSLVYFLTIKNGDVLEIDMQPHAIRRTVFHPKNNSQVALQGAVGIWFQDIEDQKARYVFHKSSYKVLDAAFNHDGSLLAGILARRDQITPLDSAIHVWSVITGSLVNVMNTEMESFAARMLFSPIQQNIFFTVGDACVLQDHYKKINVWSLRKECVIADVATDPEHYEDSGAVATVGCTAEGNLVWISLQEDATPAHMTIGSCNPIEKKIVHEARYDLGKYIKNRAYALSKNGRVAAIATEQGIAVWKK